MLNLCIVGACDVPLIKQMWANMKQLSIFFEYSPKRALLLSDEIAELAAESKKTKLVSLCKTRWVARHDALNTFSDLFPLVIATLKAMAENEGGGWSADSRVMAGGNLAAITKLTSSLPS